jgi:hypothetical protein
VYPERVRRLVVKKDYDWTADVKKLSMPVSR